MESYKDLFTRIKADQGDLMSRKAEFQRYVLEMEKRKCDCDQQVLIVGDSDFNLCALEQIIKMEYNMKCDKATNGATAMELYKK